MDKVKQMDAVIIQKKCSEITYPNANKSQTSGVTYKANQKIQESVFAPVEFNLSSYRYAS